MRNESSEPPEQGQALAVQNQADPRRAMHSDVAISHFAPQLQGQYQALTLLIYLWNCVSDPWVADARVRVAGSRLERLIPIAQARSRVVTRLVKIGALERGNRTRSGREFIMLRPPLDELSTQLRYEVDTMAASDYRRDPQDLTPKKSKTQRVPKQRTKLLPRKKLSSYLKTLGYGWSNAAAFIRLMGGGSVNYAKRKGPTTEVDALVSWMLAQQVGSTNVKPFVMLLKEEHETKPSGNALRFVFEGNTPEKMQYLTYLAAWLSERRLSESPEPEPEIQDGKTNSDVRP